MTAPVIMVNDLTKTYDGVVAVKDLTFSLEHGESFGLLGPNGAGKTTTINMISGLLKPTSGTVQINGISMIDQPLQAKINLGLVPQEFALYPALSGRENLTFFGRLYGLWGQTLKKRIAYVLHMVRLSGRGGMSVSTYSNGMKRRLNLAIGLLHDPAVIILDEPTVGVDAHSRHAIIRSLEDLAASGKTILFCTHHLWEAETFCSRVVIMDSGKIVADGTPSRLIQEFGSGLIRLDIAPPVPDELLNNLKRLGAFHYPSETAVRFQFASAEPNRDLESVLSLSAGLQVSVRAVQLLEPTLETVFLNLTGRSVRD